MNLLPKWLRLAYALRKPRTAGSLAKQMRRNPKTVRKEIAKLRMRGFDVRERQVKPCGTKEFHVRNFRQHLLEMLQ